MNKRITELAVQADKYAYKMNPEQDSYGRAANPRKFQQDRDTKFAELIVRECHNYFYDDDVLFNGVDGLLEHFGVEE